MKLKSLLKGIPVKLVKGSKEVEITGICSNSKCVAPGNLFIAKRGQQEDGNQFLAEAVSAGAAAILTDMYNPFVGRSAQLIHPHPASIEGLIAAQFYHYPSDDLYLVGITGTNGKTTCAYLVRHLLEASGISCGLIGTIEYIIGSHRYRATHTTPDALTNQRLMKEMLLSGCKAAVMEVSSHGLSQKRVAQIDYDAAIFTNLSPEHLDYHLTMEEYAKAKAELFTSLKPGRKKRRKKAAIVNADCPWSKRMLQACTAPVMTYGIDNEADVRASEIKLERDQSSFLVTYKGQTFPFKWRLIGRFNISNCLAVIALGLSRGMLLADIAPIIATFQPADGRLEWVPNPEGLSIFIDYAHTDDALQKVLECLNEIKQGKIITVFGCGGNRDKGKRARMAKVSESLSDFTIVTSDNPRDENPMEICLEIIQGFRGKESYLLEVDRREAIRKALTLVKPDDILLIAGKGHERYQIFSHKTIEFDDRIEVANFFARIG